MSQQITPVLDGQKVATQLEVSIIQLLADDNTIEAIGKKINMKARGVESRLETMRNKYNCNSSKGLITLFFRNQLIK